MMKIGGKALGRIIFTCLSPAAAMNEVDSKTTATNPYCQHFDDICTVFDNKI